MLRQSFTAGALGVALLLGGCQTDSINQSYAQAYQRALDEASSRNALDTTSRNARRVQAIAGRLRAQAPKLYPDAAQWQVNLIDSKRIGPVGGPGGKVIIYSGFFDQIQPDDDEVAALIAYTIAQAENEENRKAMAMRKMTESGAMRFMMGSDSNINIAQLAIDAETRPKIEKEATVQGLELIARAGYNPNAVVTLFQKMMQRPEVASLETHITWAREAIPQVMPLYEQANKP